MKTKILFILILSIILLPITVRADIGPKPTMEFELVYETSEDISLVSGEQLQCDDEECKDPIILFTAGPQRFSCNSDTRCFSLAYGYSQYNQLRIQFSDKTRLSQVFEKNSFSSSYKVIVKDDELVIESMMPINSDLGVIFVCFPLVLTILLEAFAAVVFIVISKLPKKVLMPAMASNLISLPIFWITIYYLGGYPLTLVGLFIFEVLIVIFEAAVIYKFNKSILSFKKAVLLSLVMNITSFLIGELVVVFLSLFR